MLKTKQKTIETIINRRKIQYIITETTITAELSIDNSKWICDIENQREFKKWTTMYQDGIIDRLLKISEYKKIPFVYRSYILFYR